MGKGKDQWLPWDTRAADVLAGKTRLDAAAWVSLVNEVNPTGRGRDARESAARYALKARLQSLLVKRFPEEIEVARDPEHDGGDLGPGGYEGVVSLRLRARPQVACHAVLEALDDEARSWAQRRLDLAPEEPERDAGPLRPGLGAPEEDEVDSSDPEAMFAAAVRAEEEFDFEEAGRLYTRAFRLRRDTRSAHALLRFLVDAMAADAEALAIGGELPAAARAHPGVRVLLGLAAARSGDEAGAMGYLAHLEDPRAAEALALVARLALGRGDTDEAAARLAEAAAADPASPALRALDAEIGKAREAERAPLEAELGRLLAEGRDGEATARAEAILARWPESEAARRAARTLEARRQNEEGRRLLTEAEAARGSGDAATALALFLRALRARLDDGDRQRARRAVDEIEAADREREAAHRAARVAAAIGQTEKQERARALGAYAELDEAIRGRVRSIVPLPLLAWIDAMTRGGTRPSAAADAALALERAAAVGDADPAGALALLAAHERAIEGVPFARRLVAEAHERVAVERRRRALADLAAAEEALAAGDAEKSHELVDRADAGLGRDERAGAEALRGRLAAFAERRQLQRRFERARASHQYVQAQLAAEALAASDGDPDQARWIEIARTFRDEVRRERRVRVFEGDGGPACSRGNYFSDYPPAAHAAVDLQGGVVVLPLVAGSEVFVRSYALETGRLVRAVHLLSPGGIDEPALDVSGGSALVMGGSNGVLEVSLATGEPLRWSNFRDPRDMEHRFSSAVHSVAGGRYLWVIHSGNLTEGHVYDLDGERPRREIPGGTEFYPLRGVSPPRVAALRNESTFSLHEPGGAQTGRLDFPGPAEAIVPHPAGEGLVVVFYRRRENPYKEEMLWGEISPQGEHLRTELITGAAGYARVSMACARDLGMVFIRMLGEDDVPFLIALAREPAGAGAPCLRVAYRIPLGSRRLLVQDDQGRRAYLVGEGDEGVEVIPLGPEAPVIPRVGPEARVRYPLTGLWGCTQPGGARSNRASAFFMQGFKWHTTAEIRERAAAYRASIDGDREALADLFWGLAVSDDAEGAAALARELVERYPGEPEIQQVSWAGLAVCRQWAGLREALGPIDPASLPEAERKHRHHLLAAACFAEGHLDEAGGHLAAAEALEGKCDLSHLLALKEALAEPLPGAGDGGDPAGDVARDLPPLRQLLAIVAAADARLARGDHEGVLALFERALVWELREAQSLARLAEAHLARRAVGEADRLRKSMALALFVDALAENRVGIRIEVLVPRATWTVDRLDALAERARAWIAEGRDP